MGTTNDRRLQYETADFTDLQNTQFAVLNANDSDLGFKMWGGKDGAGTVTRWLAKDQKIQVLDSYFSEYLYHTGDTDTFLRYEDDSIKVQAGGVEMIRLVETTQDIITVNNGQVDVDFLIRYNGGTVALFVEGSSGIVAVGTTGPTAGYKFETSGGNVLIGGAANPELNILTNSGSSGDGSIFLRGYATIEDTIGYITFTNEQVSAKYAIARIKCIRSSAGNDAGALQFETTPTGGGLTQRMCISSTGEVAINHSAALASSRLTVLDASNPQLCLAQAADKYVTAQVDGSGYLTLKGAKFSFTSDSDAPLIVADGSNIVIGDTGTNINTKINIPATAYFSVYDATNDVDAYKYTDSDGNTPIHSFYGSVGIGTTSPDRKLHVEINDAVTDTVTYLQRLTHTSSGTAAIGFGVGTDYELESDNGTAYVIAQEYIKINDLIDNVIYPEWGIYLSGDNGSTFTGQISYTLVGDGPAQFNVVGIGDFSEGLNTSGNLDVSGDIDTSGTYKVNSTQVIGDQIIDARCDDTINTSSWDSTTAGVLDALRDAMVTHGLIAAA